MVSPALDEKPDADAYTDAMVTAYTYIQKGCNTSGVIPVSEIYAYYNMFEDRLVEDKADFIYLIHMMNQPVLDDITAQVEKTKGGK